MDEIARRLGIAVMGGMGCIALVLIVESMISAIVSVRSFIKYQMWKEKMYKKEWIYFINNTQKIMKIIEEEQNENG